MKQKNKNLMHEYTDTVDVSYITDNGLFTVQFLVDYNRFKKGYISNVNIDDETYIMCNILVNGEWVDVDSEKYIFGELYNICKNKNVKKFNKIFKYDDKNIRKNIRLVTADDLHELYNLLKALRLRFNELS